MTTKDLLSWGTRELRGTAVDDPERDAELLLAHARACPREYVLAHGEERITRQSAALYKTIIDRRRQGEPVAYITTEAWFFGRPFTVTPDVLIPRPETELMVEHILQYLSLQQKKETVVIDVGTGSGAIIISTAAECPPHTRFFATDISTHALVVAQKNAAKHNLSSVITFFEGNLLDPLPHDIRTSPFSKIIAANLPYLPERRAHALYTRTPSLAFEPRIALLGGADGLDVIRGLLETLDGIAPPWTLFLEIDPEIVSALHELLMYSVDSVRPMIVRDAHGDPRLCVVERIAKMRLEKNA